MDTNGNRLPIIEALILASPEPLNPRRIADIIQDISLSEIDSVIAELNNKYLATDSAFRIRKLAGGYQIYVTENYSGYVEDLFTRRRVQRLTRAALETVAIIAYRQPVTRVDIEMIRGVSSDSAIRTLLERKFVTLSGRAKTIGRPLLYSTTNEFLEYFGLNSLGDLPRMEEIEELLSEKESDSQQTLSFDLNDTDAKGDIPPEPESFDNLNESENFDMTVEGDDNRDVIQDTENPEEETDSTWSDANENDRSGQMEEKEETANS